MEWVGVLGGLVIASISALVAYLARRDAKQAHVDAKRSADAAEKATGINTDLYEQGKVRLELNPTPELKTTHDLVNLGTHPAYDVAIDAPQVHVSLKAFSTATFRPGMRHPISVQAALGHDDRRVIVTYKRTPDGATETAEFYT